MPRPRNPYRLADGSEVPGVTTILGRFRESGGLINWAWQQGRAGKDLREERDAAAAAGTLAHALVEASLKGREKPSLVGVDPTIVDKARRAYVNWDTWMYQTKAQVEAWEKPLVCEHYKYGGTPDALLRVNEVLALGDWKTTSGGGAYVDHLLQLAAYAHLFEDAGMPIKGGFHLCLFSKESADFTHRYFEELDSALAMFLHLVHAYRLDKDLQRRVR